MQFSWTDPESTDFYGGSDHDRILSSGTASVVPDRTVDMAKHSGVIVGGRIAPSSTAV